MGIRVMSWMSFLLSLKILTEYFEVSPIGNCFGKKSFTFRSSKFLSLEKYEIMINESDNAKSLYRNEEIRLIPAKPLIIQTDITINPKGVIVKRIFLPRLEKFE